MQRIQYHRYGGPEVMQLENFDPTPPGKGQVLVQVYAAAANPMDFGIRNGDLKIVTGRRFPRAMGYDFAGVVQAVGAGVTRLQVGDEVLGGPPLKASGAFADVVLADEKGVVGKPAGVSFEDAAAIPTVGVTAWQALVNKGRIVPGQSVFVHGCLGGVGRSAVQLAVARQVQVGGSCRSTARHDAANLGVDPVVDFDFDPEPLAGRFDLVIDTAGTLPRRAGRTLLTRRGHIVDINPSPAKFVRSFLPGSFRVLVTQPVTEDLEAVAQFAGRGELRQPIDRTVPLSDAVAALTDLERRKSPGRGKLVITPGNSPAR